MDTNHLVARVPNNGLSAGRLSVSASSSITCAYVASIMAGEWPACCAISTILARGDWRPASMLAWLYTIAQRGFADEVRRRRHSYNGVPLDDLLDDVPAADDDADLARALGEAISRLSPNQQQVICMKLLRGSSFCEIASAMEVSEAAAKMRFQRALTCLRADLEQQGIGT